MKTKLESIAARAVQVDCSEGQVCVSDLVISAPAADGGEEEVAAPEPNQAPVLSLLTSRMVNTTVDLPQGSSYAACMPTDYPDKTFCDPGAAALDSEEGNLTE